jgi:NAD+ kinase
LKQKPETIRRIGLVANTEKPGCRGLLMEAARLLNGHGFALAGEGSTVRSARLELPRRRSVRELAKDSDLVLVFGGDGTILRVVREIAGCTTPLLGIHVGTLGFLAEVTASRLAEAAEQIAQGDYRIASRPLVRADLEHPAGGEPLRALNDVVFTRGEVSRMIELEVAVDGEELTRYRCDGLIVSTPTGSTAYSLAAGGAIVSPSARVFAITPICPHTLSNRSVIVDIDAIVTVRVRSEKLATYLTADGQVAVKLRVGDEVRISRAAEEVRLLQLGGSSFFRTLQQKLHWRGSHTAAA